MGPIVDVPSGRIISARFALSDIQTMNRRPLYVADREQLEFKPVGKFPQDAVRLFPAVDGPIAISGDGHFLRLDRGRLAQQNDSDAADEDELFKEIGPTEAVVVRSGHYVALNQTNQQIAVYRRGKITVFHPQTDGTYQYRAALEVAEVDPNMSAIIEFQGKWLVLALGNGQIVTIDGDQLVEKNEYLPETRAGIEIVRGSPDGRWFAFVFRNGNLWILDTENPKQLARARVAGQGTISAVSFDDQNRLWVVDRTDRASLYDLDSFELVQRFSPSGGFMEKAYRYVLGPFYRVCPKPGEFYKLVTYLSSTGDTKYNADVDLRRNSENTAWKQDPWSPLWSGLGFMFSMLLVACVIFHYTDY